MEDGDSVLVLNPARDDAFWRAAEPALIGAVSIDSFTDRLRETYPRVSFHPRELTGETVTIWHVYRDGHWTRSR